MQTFQKDPAKFILIGDFEYQCTKKDASNTKNCRVLGKLEIFTTRKKITKIIEENPKITNKEFWKHIFSIEDNNIDFDDYYGVINYRNQLAFVDVSSIIMKYQLRLKDIYFFIGELEMVYFFQFF